MKFEIRRSGAVIMQTASPGCIPDRETARKMISAVTSKRAKSDWPTSPMHGTPTSPSEATGERLRPTAARCRLFLDGRVIQCSNSTVFT